MSFRLRLIVVLLMTSLGCPSWSSAVPIPSDTPTVPPGLQKLLGSTAVFIHVDVAKIWDHPELKPTRTVLLEKWDESLREFRDDIGVDVANIKSVTYVLSLAGSSEPPVEKPATFVTTRRPIDRKAIVEARGVIPNVPDGDQIPNVVRLRRGMTLRFLSETSFSVMHDELSEEYAKTPTHPAGREPVAIREALSNEHAAVVWINLRRIREVIPPGAEALIPEIQPFFPVLACREALITAQLGKEIRAQGRIVIGGTDPEKAQKGVEALREFAINHLAQQRDRMKRGNPDRRAVELLMMDIMARGVKSIELKRDGGVITATSQLSLGDDFALKLEKAIEAQANSELPARRSNNLRHIGLAMHNYHDVYNRLPSAGTLEQNGKAKLSWRVMLLPYIDEEKLFSEFKLDEPWDSEHNLKLLKKMPKVYTIPGLNKPGDTKTHYRVFVPSKANRNFPPIFERDQGTGFLQITDGTSNTIMVVEAEQAVPWTKPEPLEYDPKKPVPALYFDERGRTGVVMADGSYRMIRKGIDTDTLRAMITRAGGEVINLD